MALTLVVEDGSGKTDSNSYVSVADADAYNDGHLYATDWTGASTATKEAALVMATRLLDENTVWQGTKKDEDQALQWPRHNAVDRGGYAIDADEIPAALANATAEYARWLIVADRTAEDGTKGFARIKAGSLELNVDKADRANLVPKVVLRMLVPIGRSADQLRLVRA